MSEATELSASSAVQCVEQCGHGCDHRDEPGEDLGDHGQPVWPPWVVVVRFQRLPPLGCSRAWVSLPLSPLKVRNLLIYRIFSHGFARLYWWMSHQCSRT